MEIKMKKHPIFRAINLFMALLMIIPTVLTAASCEKKPSGTPTITEPTLSETTPTEPTTEITPPVDLPTLEENPALQISEIMVVNNYGATDMTGKESPWIEFHNVSENEVKLSDYTLSVDSFSGLMLPDVTLAAGGYALVFVNDSGNSDSVNAELASRGLLVLYHGENVAHKVLYINKSLNHSYLTSNGSETPFPTPGYENVREKDNIIINELMASNSLFPIDGVAGDWLELYNDSEYDVDLSTYYISSDSKQPYRAKLPKITLEAGQYVVLRCENEIPFKFSKKGESVYITRNDGVLIASVTYEALEEDTVWTHDVGVVDYPSPGYANTKENSIAFINSRKGLIITEVISSNTKYALFNKKYYCDVVELYNNSDADILLSDYYLSDSEKEPQRYRLPEVTLKPGQYYLIHCDKDVAAAAPINISSDGEDIWITRADGYISDALALPAIPLNRSWGRYDGKLLYFTTPTLGKANTEGYETITATPMASIPSGVYGEAVKITLSGEGKIYYTTDGTKPTTSSLEYSGEEIVIEKSGAVRAVAYDGDRIPSSSVTYNYFINIPDYELPIIKISMSEDDLYGEKGIYKNYNASAEREANCSFYVDGKEEFSIDCGIKIFGAYSRRFPKKSFQLEFRAKYGTSRLEYDIFDNLAITSFNNIVLRSGSQNSYITDAMMTDEYLTSLAAYSGECPELFVQAYRPCNLYLNGEYWGIYFIREKIDDDYIADHCGVSKSSVTIIDWPNSIKAGSSSQGWSTIWKNVYTKKLNFSNDENYKWLADQIDLESFADLIIFRMYSGDQDIANIRAFKSPEYDGGKWHFILYDNDISFRSYSALQNRFQAFLNSTNSHYKKTHALFRALMENSQFKEYFLSRLAYHLNNSLSPANAQARLAEICDEIRGDMPYQINRWKNDNSADMIHLDSMNRWQRNVDNMNYWLSEKRVAWFVQDAVKAMKLTADDVRKYMGEEFVQYMA